MHKLIQAVTIIKERKYEVHIFGFVLDEHIHK